MKITKILLAFLIALPLLLLLPGKIATFLSSNQAPGAPGAPSVWAYAGKQGVGTSYEEYVDPSDKKNGVRNNISKVWFSIAQGILTETAYGQIDKAQIKDLQFLVSGSNFLDEEKTDTSSEVTYLHTDSSGRPLSPSYRVLNADKEGKYVIEKHIFTDPDRQTLFMRVIFKSNEDGIKPYIFINPHMNNTGNKDVAFTDGDSLVAHESKSIYLSLRSSVKFEKTSVGFVGFSDGYKDLHDNHILDWKYKRTSDSGGNVAMIAQLPSCNKGEVLDFNIAIGFGNSYEQATAQAMASLTDGYSVVLAKYNGEGNAVGWEDYIDSLSNLPDMIPYTADNGRLLYASALALKSMEDKENPGALIASLSVPWGDTVNADISTSGYRAVWPRDFYQVAMALLAMGDRKTPLAALHYLPKVQVSHNTSGNYGVSGWLLQKTRVDGTLEWVGAQMDQSAMPIMLAWKLWKQGIISDKQVADYYWDSLTHEPRFLKSAADFLASGGLIDIKIPVNQYKDAPAQRNTIVIRPPLTQQDRWEEQAGYSPSTIAAEITGLVTAADIAEHAAGDSQAASQYLMKADEFQSGLDKHTYTTNGVPVKCDQPIRSYFLRITRNGLPNSSYIIRDQNGVLSNDQRTILDAGFLELVRYGVRKADDPHILSSVCHLDSLGYSKDLKIKYDFNYKGFQFPGFRRYGNDGYGEQTNDGSNYREANPLKHYRRGRVWPLLTGERGHYELALVKAKNNGSMTDFDVQRIINKYVRAIEYFANDSYMLPEQVWDGVGSNKTHKYSLGKGTNSATPLAWSHAEYVKLVKSLSDQSIWDSYSVVSVRYSALVN